jgi:hypothetical protein
MKKVRITFSISRELKADIKKWAKKKGFEVSYAYEVIFNNGIEITGELKTK